MSFWPETTPKLPHPVNAKVDKQGGDTILSNETAWLPDRVNA